MNHPTRLVARMFCCLVLALGAGTLAAPARAQAQKPAASAAEKPIKLDSAMFRSSDMPRFAMRDGKPSPLPREQWRVLPMQDLFDALLYLGPASKITTAKLPAALCADTAYRQMRRDRMILINQKAQADQFDRDCGSPPAK